jgi:hypothetical protein
LAAKRRARPSWARIGGIIIKKRFINKLLLLLLFTFVTIQATKIAILNFNSNTAILLGKIGNIVIAKQYNNICIIISTLEAIGFFLLFAITLISLFDFKNKKFQKLILIIASIILIFSIFGTIYLVIVGSS